MRNTVEVKREMTKVVFVHDSYEHIHYFKCKHCTFITKLKNEIEDHLIEFHADKLSFREVDGS